MGELRRGGDAGRSSSSSMLGEIAVVWVHELTMSCILLCTCTHSADIAFSGKIAL